jgi:hypothetical protein
MNLVLTGEAPTAPDPAYRLRVRQRLHQRRRHLRKLAGQSAYVGHPALWTALGAAAAGLLMVVMHHLALFPGDPPHPTAAVRPSSSEPPLTAQRDELKGQLKEAEEQAQRLAAQMASAVPAAERREQEQRLRALARQLVDLDAQLLKVQVRLQENELAEMKLALDALLAEKDQRSQKRYEGLLERARKMKS